MKGLALQWPKRRGIWSVRRGADRAYGLFEFRNPERPEIMWQFVLAIEGTKGCLRTFQVPHLSGNVSFYNETNGLSIYPTPMLGMVGLIDSADKTMTQWFKQDGDVILLLGKTRQDLGGSEHLKVLHHREQGSPPLLSLETEKALHDFILKVIYEGVVQSAHDCSMVGCLLHWLNVAFQPRTPGEGLWYS